MIFISFRGFPDPLFPSGLTQKLSLHLLGSLFKVCCYGPYLPLIKTGGDSYEVLIPTAFWFRKGSWL